MGSYARAQPGPLLKTFEDLDDKLAPDLAIPVAGSRVAFADYALLAADFPELSTYVSCFDTTTVDRWLLEHASLVSLTQAKGSAINPTLNSAGSTVRVFRPPAYGRAFVTAIGSGKTAGLLDIKGAGVAVGMQPQLKTHSNGMCSLSYLFLDLVTQWILDRIVAQSLPNIYTLPVYAIIDLGFDMRFSAANSPVPAGLMIRRAHRRPKGGVKLPATRTMRERRVLEIELTLRTYGISSCGSDGTLTIKPHDHGISYRLPNSQGVLEEKLLLEELARLVAPDQVPIAYEIPNVQMTREEADSSTQVIDFEHYNAREHFDLPIVSFAYNKLLGIGGVLRPGNDFPQPNPDLSVDRMAFRVPGQHTRADGFGTELAVGFRAGKINAEELTQRLVGFVDKAIPWL